MHDKVRGDRDGWIWRTHPRKLRGRGKGAAEKRIGADLAIELEVTDAAQRRRKKTVFAQAKKEWTGRDRLLGDQARKLAELPGGALVIDYEADRFRCVTAQQAASADGNARGLEQGLPRDLGDVLAGDFLACRVGSTAVHYDASHQTLVMFEGGEVRMIQFDLENRIRTEVRRWAVGAANETSED